MALGIFDIKPIIESIDPSLRNVVGIGMVSGMVFAESGLLVGFFLPGDSLLLTAGVLASQGYLNIAALLVASFLAAVLGDNVGYTTGKRFGRRLFNKEESRFFKPDHLISAHKFYEKHGGKTIILARFVPIIRTFAPIVAGMGNMKYSTFFFYNLVGALLWAVGVTLIGYTIGRIVPDVDRYLLLVIAVVVFVSLLPTVWHVLREPSGRRAIKNGMAASYRKVRRK